MQGIEKIDVSQDWTLEERDRLRVMLNGSIDKLKAEETEARTGDFERSLADLEDRQNELRRLWYLVDSAPAAMLEARRKEFAEFVICPETVSLQSDGHLARQLWEVLEQLFPLLRQFHDKQWHGGYCCCADGHTGLPLFILSFGEAPADKWPKYLEFCREKALRLAQHPDHRSSAQSQNPEQNQWPGAISSSGKAVILSFSGLPAKLDEAFMLTAAVCMGLLMTWQAREIAALWDNEGEFERVMKAARDANL